MAATPPPAGAGRFFDSCACGVDARGEWRRAARGRRSSNSRARPGRPARTPTRSLCALPSRRRSVAPRVPTVRHARARAALLSR
eukprot:2663115-Prymnesium_polylepis.1